MRMRSHSNCRHNLGKINERNANNAAEDRNCSDIYDFDDMLVEPDCPDLVCDRLSAEMEQAYKKRTFLTIQEKTFLHPESISIKDANDDDESVQESGMANSLKVKLSAKDLSAYDLNVLRSNRLGVRKVNVKDKTKKIRVSCWRSVIYLPECLELQRCFLLKYEVLSSMNSAETFCHFLHSIGFRNTQKYYSAMWGAIGPSWMYRMIRGIEASCKVMVLFSDTFNALDNGPHRALSFVARTANNARQALATFVWAMTRTEPEKFTYLPHSVQPCCWTHLNVSGIDCETCRTSNEDVILRLVVQRTVGNALQHFYIKQALSDSSTNTTITGLYSYDGSDQLKSSKATQRHRWVLFEGAIFRLIDCVQINAEDCIILFHKLELTNPQMSRIAYLQILSSAIQHPSWDRHFRYEIQHYSTLHHLVNMIMQCQIRQHVPAKLGSAYLLNPGIQRTFFIYLKPLHQISVVDKLLRRYGCIAIVELTVNQDIEGVWLQLRLCAIDRDRMLDCTHAIRRRADVVLFEVDDLKEFQKNVLRPRS